jgi:DNA polymerase-3 subunit epsilon
MIVPRLPRGRPMTMTRPSIEDAIATLEASGDYRVLQRLKQRPSVPAPDDEVLRTAIFLDLETTGLDPTKDEIIEIALVPFIYGRANGRIYKVKKAFQGLRQPSIPIPDKITELTGIDDTMVAGKTVDPADVSAFIVGAGLVIAHNARFDRPFAERFCPAFANAAWACSLSQVPWQEEGFAGTRLEYLAMSSGFFYDTHRAADDCYAAIELLARPLPKSGALAMQRLLEAARSITCRVWAENAPFDLKDQLKTRGYRWNDGSDGRPRAWHADIPEGDLRNERDFLRKEIYQRDFEPAVTRLTARERFSTRV